MDISLLTKSLPPEVEEFAKIGIWHYDIASDKIELSTNLCRIYEIGQSRFEGSFEEYSQYLHPESISEVRNNLKNTAKENSSFSFDKKIVTSKQNIKQLRCWCTVILNNKNTVDKINGITIDITQILSSENSLKESEEFNRKLVQNSPYSILIQSLDGTIRYANQKAAELIKAPSVDHLIGKNTTLFTDPLKKEAVDQRAKEIFKTGKASSKLEQEFTCIDGTKIIGESVVVPFEYEGEKSILIITNNITREKEALKALENSESNLREFIKHTPIAVAMFDRNMNYVACSKNYLENWWVEKEKITADQIVGQNHYTLFSDVKDEWKAMHKQALRGETFVNEDDFFIKKNGKKEWLRWKIHPWYNSSNIIGGVILFTEFITTRKEGEIALNESRNRLNTLIQNLPGLVYSCDTSNEFKLKFVSSGCLKLTEYSHDEFIEKSALKLDEIIHPADLPKVHKAFKSAVKNKKPIDIEYRIITKSGKTKYVSDHAQVIFSDQGEPLSIEGVIMDVTENTHTQKALKRSNDSLDAAQSIAHLGSWEWDVSTNKIRWSDEYFRICGEKPQSFEPSLEVASTFIHPDDFEELQSLIERTVSTGKPYEMDKRITRKDGTIRYVQSRGQLLKNDDGTLKIIGSMQDLTDRKLIEIQLAEIQNRNEALLNALPDSIFLVNYFGDILDCQISRTSTTKTTKEQLIGSNVTQYLGDRQLNFIKQKVDIIKTRGLMQHIEFPLDINGNRMHFEARLVPYENDKLLCLLRNITKNKEDELQAAESKESFAKVFHNTSAAVTLTSCETREFIDVNQKWLDILNLKRDQVIGKTPQELNLWKVDEDFLKLNEELTKYGRIENFEAILRTNDNGDRNMLLSTETTNFNNKPAHVTISFDITEKKKSEKNLVKLTEELTTTNAELRQFAYITSHDLRSPVVNIDSLLKLYTNDFLGDKDKEEILGKIITSVGQLKSTLSDLIQLVAIKDESKDDFSEIDLEKIINSVKINLEHQIVSTRTKIECNFEEAQYVTSKKATVNSIIQNLISNAIKYNDRKPIIIISAFEHKQYTVLSVKDNGIGIDLNQHKSKIFGMYQRFHENREGKGLGLYIIKSQIESLGGFIEVDSEVGIGTEFKVYFKKQIND